MIDYPVFRSLPDEYVRSKIKEFLAEDAPRGDITTDPIFDRGAAARAYIEAQSELVFAGESLLDNFFGKNCRVDLSARDGDSLESGDIIANIEGPAAEILKIERPLLNLLQRLCGIATQTLDYAKIASPYGVKILDTRKTTPGLRLFEKYAVAVGGGFNHRLDLSSGILIKDNHIQAAGGIDAAVRKIRGGNHTLPVELEIDRIDQIHEGLAAGADGFLLDNMSPEECRKAVEMIRHSPGGGDIFIEASGGITLSALSDYVSTGVNAISVGALTHSVKAADIHIEFE
jgi:nicotinate-nucleotide pyrophosphorylase (carboxylating)